MGSQSGVQAAERARKQHYTEKTLNPASVSVCVSIGLQPSLHPSRLVDFTQYVDTDAIGYYSDTSNGVTFLI